MSIGPRRQPVSGLAAATVGPKNRHTHTSYQEHYVRGRPGFGEGCVIKLDKLVS